jgi:hypothetical protein
MKTIKQWLLCLLIIPLLFSSCQKSKQPSHLLSIIPKDAKFVLAVNKEQLIKKSGLNHLNDFSFYGKLRTELAQKGINLENDYLLNSKKRGMGLEWGYFFMENEIEKARFVYLTDINDQNLLEQNIQNILNTLDQPAPEIQDKLSYKMITIDNTAVAVWNDKLFYIMGGNLDGVNYDDYFRRSAEESLMSLPDFNAFSQRIGDLGFWLPMQVYAELIEQASKWSGTPLTVPILSDMAGINVHAYLDFNDDEIKMDAVVTPEEKMDAFYEKYPIMKWEHDRNMLNDFPATSYFAMKTALNLPQYVKMLKETMSGVGYPMAQITNALESSEVNAVLNILGGEMLFSLYGFAEGPMSLPLLGLSFTVNGEEGFQKLLAMLPQEMLNNNGKYYEVSTGVAGVYFAYKDNRIFVTDDEKGIETFIGSGNSKNIAANTAIGDAVKTSPTLFYINLNLNDYPKLIREALSSYLPRDAMDVLNVFKDFSMYMTSKYDVQASLTFRNNKENPLKWLIKLIDKNS